ncbi:MAG: radical SAM protein [Candidatus Scalindua sp.]|jgi:GTP 3',8-cyclase|nr:radical SAM protein [Candidatus Scalindua sp.]
MNKYRIDSHKLMYHLPLVCDWLNGENICPIYMEISLVGSCNHRCVFCAYDFIGYPNRKLDCDRLLRFIDEAKEAGVKSFLFAGEGEPLLHPDIEKFIIYSKNSGIDVGLFTNGQLLREELAESILPFLTFVRFSFNGGTKENYADIHKVKPAVFEKVVSNIKRASEIKERDSLDVDIGVQYVLLPENVAYLIKAVKTLKDTGIGYFVIKPFVQQSNLQSYRIGEQLDLNNIEGVLNEAESFSNKNFMVIARRESFEGYGKKKYKHCYGTSFVSVLNSAGDIATCLPYWDKEDFVIGNINKNTFRDIWFGGRRKKIKGYLESELSVQECPPNCRPNAINEFLWNLKSPPEHINFV